MAQAAESVRLEIQTSLQGGASKCAQRLTQLNRQIRQACNVCAEYVGSRKQLPAPSASLRPNTAVGKAAHEFGSSEEYAFFALLSIVNQRVYETIFTPFHPVAAEEENKTRAKTYDSKEQTDSQLAAGTWRSEEFRTLERTTRAKTARFIDATVLSIVTQFTATTEVLLPQGKCSPPKLPSLLKKVLRAALDWNKTVKTEITKYDLEPYIIRPCSQWDPAQMESFERLPRNVTPRISVSPVAFGLAARVIIERKRVRYVQQKAQVLVDAWFHNTPTLRAQAPSSLISASAPPSQGRGSSARPRSKGFLRGLICC